MLVRPITRDPESLPVPANGRSPGSSIITCETPSRFPSDRQEPWSKLSGHNPQPVRMLRCHSDEFAQVSHLFPYYPVPKPVRHDFNAVRIPTGTVCLILLFFLRYISTSTGFVQTLSGLRELRLIRPGCREHVSKGHVEPPETPQGLYLSASVSTDRLLVMTER